jgi:hypothetical protein
MFGVKRMLPTKKPGQLKIGDKLLGGKIITRICTTFRYDIFKYNYTVYFNNSDGQPSHIAYDYLEDANIITG